MTITEIALPARSELAIADGQVFFNEKQLAALKQIGVDGASNADLAIFFHQCVRTGLDPFAKQICMVERQGKQTIQTQIDGFRLVARRAADAHREPISYGDTYWCGEDGKWVDVWVSSKPPVAAKAVVYRDGQAFPAVALTSEYIGRKADGNPNVFWKNKPSLMIAKCAEALALRKAFPQDLSGIYTEDEMQRDDYATDEPQQPARDRSRSGVDRLRAAVVDVEPANVTPPEQSNRDWADEAKQVNTVELLSALWAEARSFGELTEDLKAALQARADEIKAAAEAENGDGPVPTDDDFRAMNAEAAAQQGEPAATPTGRRKRT